MPTQTKMESESTSVPSTTETEPPRDVPDAPVLRLRLKKPKQAKKVGWTEDTIDNEHMNKKKSKCCCVFEKQREFGESSSDTDDECDHCKGHVELKNKKDNFQKSAQSNSNGDEPNDTRPEHPQT